MRLYCSCRNALLGIALSLTAIAAQASETLTIWCHRGVAALQESAARYQQRTGIQVVVENPVNAVVNFEIKAAVGAGPDIFCWGHDRLGDWAAAGLLAPVGEPQQLERLDLLPWTWPAVTVSGKRYGYPLFVETLGLIINPKLVASPPADLLDLPQFAANLAPGIKPLAWPWLDAYFSWPLLAQDEGYVFGQDRLGQWQKSDLGLAKPAVARAVGWWLNQMASGLLPPPVENGRIRNWFAKGELAMMIDGPWVWRDLDRLGGPWQLVPWPTFGRKPIRPFVGVQVAVINAFSPRQDLAQDFLQNHLLTPSEMALWAASGELGAMTQRQVAEQQKGDPRVAIMLATAEQGVIMPNISAMGRFWAVMTTTLDNLANGRQTPNEALADAEARIRRGSGQ